MQNSSVNDFEIIFRILKLRIEARLNNIKLQHINLDMQTVGVCLLKRLLPKNACVHEGFCI